MRVNRPCQGVRDPQTIPQSELVPRIDNLSSPLDLEQSVVGCVVAHRDVAALFKTVRDSASVPAVGKPIVDLSRGLLKKRGQRYGVGVFEFIEDVGELGILWRAVGIDDRPESCGLGRRPSG